MAASITDICNSALNQIGASNILNLTEDSKAARICNQRYEYIRDSVFRAHPWKALTRRATLAPDSVKPAFEFDNAFVYMALADAQKYLNKGNRISEIQVAVYDPDDASQIAERIEKELKGTYRVRSWNQLNAALFSALKLEKIVMFIFLSLAILVASFCIVATLTMLVLEKGSEVSVLMTLGTSGKEIQSIFRFEGLLIGIVGTVSGLLVGFGLCLFLSTVGLPIDPEVWYIDKLPVDISVTEFLLVGLASIVITQLATIYPAYAAALLTPVEGLKNE